MLKQLFPALAMLMALGLVIVSPSCTSEYIQPVSDICFETEVLPIFQSNCTQSGCHNSTDRTEGYVFDSYENIVSRGIVPGDYKKSEVYKAIVPLVGSSMPPSPYERLSDEQISTIALWIEEGAQNTTNCASNLCDTTAITFSTAIKPILQTYCYGCHAGSAPQGNINLSNYTGVKTTAQNGTLVGSIEHTGNYSPMPQNANKLSTCTIEKFKIWVAAGAPNN